MLMCCIVHACDSLRGTVNARIAGQRTHRRSTHAPSVNARTTRMRICESSSGAWSWCGAPPPTCPTQPYGQCTLPRATTAGYRMVCGCCPWCGSMMQHVCTPRIGWLPGFNWEWGGDDPIQVVDITRYVGQCDAWSRHVTSRHVLLLS